MTYIHLHKLETYGGFPQPIPTGLLDMTTIPGPVEPIRADIVVETDSGLLDLLMDDAGCKQLAGLIDAWDDSELLTVQLDIPYELETELYDRVCEDLLKRAAYSAMDANRGIVFSTGVMIREGKLPFTRRIVCHAVTVPIQVVSATVMQELTKKVMRRARFY